MSASGLLLSHVICPRIVHMSGYNRSSDFNPRGVHITSSISRDAKKSLALHQRQKILLAMTDEILQKIHEKIIRKTSSEVKQQHSINTRLKTSRPVDSNNGLDSQQSLTQKQKHLTCNQHHNIIHPAKPSLPSSLPFLNQHQLMPVSHSCIPQNCSA